MKASIYFKKLIFPLLWLLLMNVVIALRMVRPVDADYFFCLYFGGFFVWFVFVKREVSIGEWARWMRCGSFWRWVALTIVAMAVLYGIGCLPGKLFPELDIVFFRFPVKRAYDLPSAIAFFFSAIVFPALGQELFYRKAIICFDSRKTVVLSTVAGCVLFGFNDNLNLFGIIRSGLLGLALSLPYLKTRNIYVPVTAHYLVSILLTLLSWLA